MAAPGSPSKGSNNPKRNINGGKDASSTFKGGRVRVVARIRPLSSNEQQQSKSEQQQVVRKLYGPSGSSAQLIQISPPDNGGSKRWFELDSVCDGTASQRDVYQQSGAARAITHDLLQGYNTSILAYGQTGAGKTFTMSGGADANDLGIIPRACNDLFKAIHETCDKASVTVSYLELYNEQIRDLFDQSSSTADDSRKANNSPNNTTNKPQLRIREAPDGSVQVQGVVERKVKSSQDILSALDEASTRRVVAATAMNSASSRSHAICTIRVKGLLKAQASSDAVSKDETTSDTTQEPPPPQKFTSKLTLVDLAGSERIKKTGAQGARQTEGININKSLLVLGQVVSALSARGGSTTKPPYRDSKLTRLLQDSLGGNSRTILLACVSPALANLEETTNTLRYAASARRITNKIRQNVASTADKNKEMVVALQSENSQLRDKVQDLEATVQKLQAQLAEAEQAKKQYSKRPRPSTLRSQSNFTASTAGMSDDDDFFEEEEEETSTGETADSARQNPAKDADTKVPQHINFAKKNDKGKDKPEKDDESVSSAPKTAEQQQQPQQQQAVDPLVLELSNHKLLVAQLKEQLDTFEQMESQNEELHRKLAEVRDEADTARMAATYLSDIVDELKDLKQGEIEKKKQELQMRFKEKKWISFVQDMLEKFRTNAAGLSEEFDVDVVRMLEKLKVGEDSTPSSASPSSTNQSSPSKTIPPTSETQASSTTRSANTRRGSMSAVPSQDELLRMSMESSRAPRRRISMTGFSSYLWKSATSYASDAAGSGESQDKNATWRRGTTKFQHKIGRIERMIAAEAESMRTIQTNLSKEYDSLELEILEQQAESESLFPTKDNGSRSDLVDHLSCMLLQRQVPTPTVTTCATFS